MAVTGTPRYGPDGLPQGSRLLGRVARPLHGREIGDAVRNHVLDLATQLLKREAVKDEQQETLLQYLREQTDEKISKQERLQKMHITYPKVGWIVRVRLERLDDAGLDHAVHAECDLDLERNLRICLQFGESGLGSIVDSIEDERLSTPRPDEIRQQRGLPVEVEMLTPDGSVEKVDVTKLKRAARTVDVGSGAVGSKAVQVHGEKADEGAEVQAALVAEGEQIVTPAELPEIDLDSVGGLVAEPPKIEKAPSEAEPEPVGGMGKTSRPNARVRR